LGSENIQIVLEEDGTEVLEDEYLLFLDNNTKLMILPSNYQWNPPIPAFDVTDCPGTENSNYNPVKILQKLVRSPGSIALLSEEELDVVSSFTSHQNIGIPQTEVEYLIGACQRELEQKKKIKDALNCIKEPKSSQNHILKKPCQNTPNLSFSFSFPLVNRRCALCTRCYSNWLRIAFSL
jgi:DNA fragmentation factor alpha subunit